MSVLDLGIGKKPGVEVDPYVIPLPNLTDKCMKKFLTWLEKHKDDPEPSPDEQHNLNVELTEWDKAFLDTDHSTLFDLMIVRILFFIFNIISFVVFTWYVIRLSLNL